MATATATVTTEHASRYLQQLCKHWGHKFEVQFDPLKGSIVFDENSSCGLSANPVQLVLAIQHIDADKIERLQAVVEDHVKRFAFREELKFVWRHEN